MGNEASQARRLPSPPRVEPNLVFVGMRIGHRGGMRMADTLLVLSQGEYNTTLDQVPAGEMGQLSK